MSGYSLLPLVTILSMFDCIIKICISKNVFLNMSKYILSVYYVHVYLSDVISAVVGFDLETSVQIMF